jgi:hypothetical protein
MYIVKSTIDMQCELFNIEHKHWKIFRKMHASIPDKIQQEIISKVGDVFMTWKSLITSLLYKQFYIVHTVVFVSCGCLWLHGELEL